MADSMQKRKRSLQWFGRQPRPVKRVVACCASSEKERDEAVKSRLQEHARTKLKYAALFEKEGAPGVDAFMALNAAFGDVLFGNSKYKPVIQSPFYFMHMEAYGHVFVNEISVVVHKVRTSCDPAPIVEALATKYGMVLEVESEDEDEKVFKLRLP